MRTWHLTFNDPDRNTLFHGERELRLAVRTIHRIARERLVLFSIADDHVHIVLEASASKLGRLCRSLLISLRHISEIPILPAYVRAVRGQPHLQNLVFYHLRQPTKHGLPSHPALWTGSCFQDLAGARRLADLPSRLQGLLPRFRLSVLLPELGVPPEALEPASSDLIQRVGVKGLAEAASSAFCVPPDLEGITRAVVQARTAVVQLGRWAGIPVQDLSQGLGVSRRSVFRCYTPPMSPEYLRAVALRVSLEETVRHTTPPGPPSRTIGGATRAAPPAS